MFQKSWQVIKWIFVLCIAAVMTGCVSQPAPTAESSVQIANPASENCVQQGGTLAIEKRGDGGEYGVCLFEDNRQCEEWALMRGECPAGGLKVTGYTPASTYCVITGGTYTITNTGNEDGHERGDCTFKNGNVCGADDLFNGICDPNIGAKRYSDPFLYCAAVGTIDIPDEQYTGGIMPDSITRAMVEQGIVAADAPKEVQQNAVWRCMDKSVLACHYGANIPCREKADLNQTPSPAMEDYCKANPGAEVIPADATGRATVYEWKCMDGKPEAGQQILNSDPQGFITEFWYQLAAG